MKKIVLVLTEAEAKAIDHALGNTLNALEDARDVFGVSAWNKKGRSSMQAAYRGRSKLCAAIRGEVPGTKVTNAEATYALNAITSYLAGPCLDDRRTPGEVAIVEKALEGARAKIPDGPFIAIPITHGTLTQEE